MENGKWKTEAKAIFLSLFAHRAKGSWCVICLLMEKQKEVINLQTDQTD
jgi:hypothetical protein